MADTFTPNYEFVLPEIGGSIDTWGNKLNENFSELDTILQRLMPPGAIIDWYGSTSEIPEGWALCDGTNGTPDLRGLFIVGAGGQYDIGDTGGSNSVTLTTSQMPSHSHGGSTGNDTHGHSASTGNSGNHSHSGSTNVGGAHRHQSANVRFSGTADGGGTSNARIARGNVGGDLGVGSINAFSTGTDGGHYHSLSINSNGAHNHSVTVNSNTHSHSIPSQGGGEPHENRPPFYALHKIMKL